MLIPMYLNRLALMNYRPATRLFQRRVLSNLERHLAPHSLADANRYQLEAFLGRPLAPGSRRSYRSCLRTFYAWAADEGFVEDNPAQKIPAVRVARGIPRPLDEGALRVALMRADARMRAWLLLMSLAGLRCIEVAALTPDDLMRTESGWLLYLRECKGGGTAVLPAHTAVVAALLALPISANLWWAVGAQQVSRTVGAHLRSAGIDATAHQLRHTAATMWLRESGHDLLTTAALMRHKSVETTQGYAALDPIRPAQVVAGMSIPWLLLGESA